MTDGIKVEEGALEDESGGDSGGGGSGRRRGKGRRIWSAFVELVGEVIRAAVAEFVGVELSRLGEKYERFERRLRVLGILVLTFLVFGIVAFTVWTLVGVAWLAANFPATADPLVFAAGGVVGYLVAVFAGLVYSR